MRVRSSGVYGDGPLELPDRRRHIVCLSVGSSEQHVERTAVSRRLYNAVEHRRGPLLVLRILRLYQAHAKRIKRFQVGMELYGAIERLGRLRVFLFPHPCAALDTKDPRIVGVDQ